MTRIRNKKNQPKLKNKQIISDEVVITAGTDDWFEPVTLITNTGNVDTGYTGYVETIGNFSLDCLLAAPNTGIKNVAAFVMYVPESYTIDSELPIKHPEWILCYKFLGSPTGTSGSTTQGMQPTRIRSIVRRNLMTGDRIILFIQGLNSTSNNMFVTLDYLLKFASRIN